MAFDLNVNGTRHSIDADPETPDVQSAVVSYLAGLDAVYAAIFNMSSAVSFATTGFMSSDQAPFRTPVCMSCSCRTT